MDQERVRSIRKSHMELGEIYFWTATIHKWIPLLQQDSMKKLIVDSLENLSERKKIEVFAFVIMPNHLHLIWKLKERNGKEMPHTSFLKFTAQQFRKILSETQSLAPFWVERKNKDYEFWQRDSLAIHLFTRKVAYQKLDYIHKNPLSERWNLCAQPADYAYSTAGFYENDEKRFAFLKDIRLEF
jgi:putative transposase